MVYYCTCMWQYWQVTIIIIKYMKTFWHKLWVANYSHCILSSHSSHSVSSNWQPLRCSESSSSLNSDCFSYFQTLSVRAHHEFIIITITTIIFAKGNRPAEPHLVLLLYRSTVALLAAASVVRQDRRIWIGQMIQCHTELPFHHYHYHYPTSSFT